LIHRYVDISSSLLQDLIYEDFNVPNIHKKRKKKPYYEIDLREWKRYQDLTEMMHIIYHQKEKKLLVASDWEKTNFTKHDYSVREF
jgi:hypothetical protein